MNDEERQVLRDAHRFAVEHLRDTNRAVWTRVAALLTVNSLLVAGFALLYGSKYPNATLLLTIAASGIVIQAAWPIFAITSYPVFEYLRQLMKDIEEYRSEEYRSWKKSNLGQRAARVWTEYEKYHQEFHQQFYQELLQMLKLLKFWKWRPNLKGLKGIIHLLAECLKHFWENYPSGGFSTIIFFVVFLVLWIIAAAIVNTSLNCHLLAILIPFAVNLLAAILCIRIWKRTKNAPVKTLR